MIFLLISSVWAMDSLQIFADQIEYHKEENIIDINSEKENCVCVSFGQGEDQKKMNAKKIHVVGKKSVSQKETSELDRIEADGDVVLTHKDLVLKGDRCVYHALEHALKDGVVVCTGHVSIEDKKKHQMLVGHEGTFNLKTHTYTLKAGASDRRVHARFPDQKKLAKLGRSGS